MKKKLKKKIWLISSIILIAYVAILITNPTSLLTLLPIIIPTAILTAGIPAYAIIKHVKETLEEIPENYSTIIQQPTTKNTKSLEKKTVKQNTDLIDDIINDDNLTPQNKKQMLKTLRTEYESDTKEADNKKLNDRKIKKNIKRN